MKNFSIRLLNYKISLFILAFLSNSMQFADQTDDRNKLIQLASGHIIARAIHIAAKMRIADHLIDGPSSLDTLADKMHVDAQSLYRLLRLLVSYDIFYEDDQHNVSLTPLAHLLISKSPNSLQAWLAYHDGDENRWQSYGFMEHSIITGRPTFDHLFGEGYFDCLAQDSQLASKFDEGMRTLSEKEDNDIAASYNFSDYAAITDIGGGKGGLIGSIMQNHFLMQGMIYDLPHVESSAESYLFDHALDQFVTFRSGSFFDEIPQGADLYIVKRILHDWDDQACLQILSNCRKVMHQDTKLLIIEAIVPADNSRDFIKDIDIAMLVLFGGQERTYDMWQKLIHAAGLQLVAVHNTPSMLSILELQIKS